MKLVGPPLHISTMEEMKIFNTFMRDHPRPTSRTWLEMATFFKGKADYRTVFPKLPSMLRAHYGKWKVTQELKMIKASINEKYYHLLKRLGIPTEAAADTNPGGRFQKEASDKSQETTVVPDIPTDETVNNFDDVPENPHNVAPMGSEGQVQYNPTTNGKSNKVKRCSGAPFGCPHLAVECSGMTGGWRECRLVIRRDDLVKKNIPASDEDAEAKKNKHLNDERNAKKREKRRMEREAREAEALALATGA